MSQEIRDALARLVELHDGPRDEKYETTKAHAWALAREALGRVGDGSVLDSSAGTYDLAACPLPRCGGSLYLVTTYGRPIYLSDSANDLAHAAGAHTQTWRVECENEHVILNPDGCNDSEVFGAEPDAIIGDGSVTLRDDLGRLREALRLPQPPAGWRAGHTSGGQVGDGPEWSCGGCDETFPNAAAWTGHARVDGLVPMTPAS